MNVQDVLPRDAISSIDVPTFSATYFGDSSDQVLVFESDRPRAYPIRILSYHEIVNDRVDDTPIAVTWCPICWSGIIYDRRVDDQILTFGVSGKLADDALVMYDRETESDWQQPTGLAIAGPCLGSRLTPLSGLQMTFGEFVDRYPNGVVLDPANGDPQADPAVLRARYDMDRYTGYVEGEGFGLAEMRGEGPERSWTRTDIAAKTVVLGIESNDEAVGYPEHSLEASGGVVTDTAGGLDVVVVATGSGLFAYRDPGYSYRLQDAVLFADGAHLDPITGMSDDGRQLERVPGRQMFAFAWQDAHGPDAFYTTPTTD